MTNRWWVSEGAVSLPARHEDSVRRVRSYLSFLISGLRNASHDQKKWRFLAEEMLAKLQRLKSQKIRHRFETATSRDFIKYPSPGRLDQVGVVSLCHASAIPEQKLSILSFLRHVGSPKTWTIVSDGSLTTSHVKDLHSLHPCIEVVDWQSFLCDANRETCAQFLKYTLFAKKLALESNMPAGETLVYADTDILFLSGAVAFRHLLAESKGRCFYQQDLPGYLDGSILTSSERCGRPLNAGFVVLGRRIDWTLPLERLRQFLSSLPPDEPMSDLEKLEQATVHLAHHHAGSEPLDDLYVLQISDRASRLDLFCHDKVVLRHYTRPVRHKMWLHAHEYLV